LLSDYVDDKAADIRERETMNAHDDAEIAEALRRLSIGISGTHKPPLSIVRDLASHKKLMTHALNVLILRSGWQSRRVFGFIHW
jgi:hypothetical protein